MKFRWLVGWGLWIAVITTGVSGARAEETAVSAPWNLGLSGGVIVLEGDEAVGDGGLLGVSLGYELTPLWDIECSLLYAPSLSDNPRFDVPTQREVSRLATFAGDGVDESDLYVVAVDALFHPLGRKRLDPFVSLGLGASIYEEDVDDESLDPVVRLGCGLLYHIDDRWALRANGLMLVSGEDTEFNLVATAGLLMSFGGGHEVPVLVSAPAAQQEAHGPEPVAVVAVDTDGDGLTDEDELKVHETDPNNPDSDFDHLSDGDEVNKHQTNPLLSDSDNGGVRDGHEVLEDGTDPLQKADDWTVYELNMQFDEDAWEVKPEYFAELDVIGRYLARVSKATAKLEGHVDHRRGRTEKDELRLTGKRAQSVADYLGERWKVSAKRMKVRGFGASWPKAKNDPETGNIVNRRIEVYIEPVSPDPADK